MAYQLRVLEGQLNEAVSQENNLVRVFLDSKNSLDTLNSLKSLKAKKGSEVLLPIGSGIFVKVVAPSYDKFMVSVGSNVVIEKKLGKTSEFIEERLKEIEKAVTSHQSKRFELEGKVNGLRQILSGMIQQQQAK